jgi:hypothetical protein
MSQEFFRIVTPAYILRPPGACGRQGTLPVKQCPPKTAIPLLEMCKQSERILTKGKD